MATLVLEVIDGSDPGRTVELSRPVTIGSADDADVTLADPSLAPVHARITPTGGEASVEDLGSDSGTFVEEFPVHEPFTARAGEEIRVGLSVVALFDRDGSSQSASDEGQGPLRVEASAASFVPQAVLADLDPATKGEEGPVASAENRYGPLATWTDERVKHQTFAAAIGLIGVVALIVAVFFID